MATGTGTDANTDGDGGFGETGTDMDVCRGWSLWMLVVLVPVVKMPTKGVASRCRCELGAGEREEEEKEEKANPARLLLDQSRGYQPATKEDGWRAGRREKRGDENKRREGKRGGRKDTEREEKRKSVR